MDALDYVWLGILAVFQGPEALSIFGIAIPITILMVLAGFLLGIVVGSTARPWGARFRRSCSIRPERRTPI